MILKNNIQGGINIFKKVVISLVICLLMMGFVSAVDITSFKVPSNFEDIGSGIYVQYGKGNNPDQSIAVLEYTKYDADDYYKNDTKYGYTTTDFKNNTTNFVDKQLNERGTFEFIKVDGKTFIVESWFSIDDKQKDFDVSFQNLVEFNKLNNVTPLNASEVVNK